MHFISEELENYVAAHSENEPELVETASDDTGKRYVPESRFKEIYAKWKKAEQEAKAKGKEFFIHGNRNRKPVHALTETQKTEVEQIYLSKYFDCTYTAFTARCTPRSWT